MEQGAGAVGLCNDSKTHSWRYRESGQVQAPERGPRMIVTIEVEWVRGGFIEYRGLEGCS